MESRAIRPEQRTRDGVRWRACAAVLSASAMVVLLIAHALAGARVDPAGDRQAAVTPRLLAATEKTSGAAGWQGTGARKHEDGAIIDADGFPWSNEMLQWQRTGFHFQPAKNYMNGPMYYRGWYHFFYQHNPHGAVWGDMVWGHAVSRDMVHWRHLPLAMVPDHWYDINGVFTGSATVLPDGKVILLYTGNSNTSAQVQCLPFPADPNDPLLHNWTKHPANPVILPPPGVRDYDFLNPTTAWFEKSDKPWRIVIGSKDDHGHAGIALMYKTKDFVKFELIPGPLHRVEGTGMWECIDFYTVGGGNNSSEEVLYVMKASMDDEWHDYYALGRFNKTANTWTPLDPEADVGIGLRYNWGKLFASTTFYDSSKQRRVLWGYVGETDSKRTNVAKGWASLQVFFY